MSDNEIQNGFKCKVCGQQFKRIHNHYISNHNLTSEQYEALPDYEINQKIIESSKFAMEAIAKEMTSTARPGKTYSKSSELFDHKEFQNPKRFMKFGIANVFSFAGSGDVKDISASYWDEESQMNIPDEDKTFVPNQNILEMVALGIQSNIPLYLFGPTGGGKTSHIQYLAAKMRVPMKRINLNGDTRASDLMGTREIETDENGNSITKFDPGIVTQCMQKGWWLLLDEMDCAKPGIVMTIQAILERTTTGKKSIYVPKFGTVDVHPLFRIFGTGNTNGRGEFMEQYPGTQVLNEAFMDRFALSAYCEYDWTIIAKAISHRYPEASKFIPQIVKTCTEAQKAFEEESCQFTLSPRKAFVWAEIACKYSAYGADALHKSAMVVIMTKLSQDDRNFFTEMYQRITGVNLSKYKL